MTLARWFQKWEWGAKPDCPKCLAKDSGVMLKQLLIQKIMWKKFYCDVCGYEWWEKGLR